MNEQKINILTVSWELFFQYGIKSVTMDDIATKLGISKKTLYQYFSNKKELITEACRWDVKNPRFSFRSEKIAHLNAIDQHLSFFEFVNELLQIKCDSLDYDLKKYYPEVWAKFKAEKIKLFQQDIAYNLQKGIDEGLYRPELNINFIGKNLVSFYLNLNTIEYQVFSQDEMFNINMHRELTLYHLYGICTNKGIEYFKNKFK